MTATPSTAAPLPVPPAPRYPPPSGEPHTPHPVRDTSAQAFTAGGVRKLGRQSQEVVDLVLGAQRNGAADLSLREIQQSYERRFGKRIELGTVSARVNALVTAGRLARKPAPRPCAITGMNVRPVFVPAAQSALFAKG